MCAGILLAVFYPDIGLSLKPLGDGFIKLIKMIVPMIVFCVVVQGIHGAGELRKVGRVGLKALIYFEVVTTIALLLGVVLAYVFHPGAGMNIDASTLDASSLTGYVDNANAVRKTGLAEFILKLIPTTVVSAFTSGDVLQVLLFSVIFGCALSLIGDKALPVATLIDSLATAFFKCMSFIIKLAPLGVFGAIAFTVGKYGIGSLKQLAMLVLLFYGAVIVFVFVILGAILRAAGFNIFKLVAYLREELLIVLGTASSDSVLPQVMRKLKYMGIKDSTVGLVIPTGYSFNLDAFSIYLTLAAVFIAQATNTPLAIGDLLSILAIALITSKGAHGVPGSAIVILAATLTAMPTIPVVGLVLVLSVDWFIGIARAAGNLVGNCVATVVVAAWEKDIDRERAHSVLNGKEKA
ncbi:MAG TPA: C4-dicarboxylate transporter DctA [Duganella sp.]|nr:C4-dicarboxylate transporter DctA [Duganella sp.]